MRNYCFYFFALLSTIIPLQVWTVSVEPTGYRIIVEPNSTEEFLFTITNTASGERVYNVRFVDGQDILATSTISNWFIAPKSITISPESSESLRIDLTVPLSAIPGDRYTYLMIREESSSNAVAVVPEIAVPITVTVAGEIQEAIIPELSPLSIKNNSAHSELSIKNTGMVEVPVQGTFHIATRDGVRAEMNIQTPIRVQDVYMREISAAISPWYIGPVEATFMGTYGVFSEQISTKERVWYVSKRVQVIGVSIVAGCLIGLLLYQRKRASYVQDV